jgi:ferrous-iron efflux pump FieF
MDEVKAQRLRRRAALLGVGVAATLATTKLVAAVLTGSISVLSSLADSLADLVASCLTFWTVGVANSPADEDHRFGHGKAEALSALVQAALLLGAGVFVVVQAIERVLVPTPIARPWLALAVMGLSMLGSLVVVYGQSRALRRVDSLAIEADRSHYTGDALSNLAVILAVWVESTGGWIWVDPLVGVAVATVLVTNALSIGRRSVDLLMDKELADDVRARIESLVRSDPDVRDMHDLRTRSLGTGAHIDFHLELDGDLTLDAAHVVTDRVEQALRVEFPGSEVAIHQEPAGLDDERLDDRVRAAT